MNEGNKRAEDPRLIRIESKLDVTHDESVRVANELVMSKRQLSDWQALHEQWCRTEIKRIDDTLKPLKEAFEVVDRPARYIGRTILVICSGGLIFAGERFMAWFVRHFG